MAEANAGRAAQPDPYARVVRRFSTAAKLASAGQMLNWDARTQMPPGGAMARAEQIAALAEVIAERVGGPAAADELAEAEAMAGALTPDERADLGEMRRSHLHAAAAPPDRLAAKARLAQRLQAIWTRAKPEDDFAAFADPFAELLEVIREIAAAKAEALGTSRYGALMDEFDPGVGEALIDPVFDDLARTLPPLLVEVRERQAAWSAPVPLPRVAADRQALLARRLALAVGHDPDHFRIDATAHPFSVPHSPGDVRFTTRYDEGDVRFCVMATLHEAGHAMYEFNLPRELAFRPVGDARGMTVHESQSLSVERLAGRSREFLGFLGPLMAEVCGGDLAAWTAGNLVNHMRRLDDGFIRVQADEIAYPLHVILRWRLEKALLSGDLAVADLPGAWDEAFEALFGRRPPSLALGCLQDVHWAAGMIGYFPNYAMGAILAAQLFERAQADDPGILPAIGRGDFGPYFGWVRPRVHERASRVPFDALVREATGAPLSAEPFKRHLRRRYLDEPAP